MTKKRSFWTYVSEEDSEEEEEVEEEEEEGVEECRPRRRNVSYTKSKSKVNKLVLKMKKPVLRDTRSRGGKRK